jgi:peptidoglycan/LPS O-acetylase OafA/YrhL
VGPNLRRHEHYPAFDWFRLLLAVEVVGIHTAAVTQVFINPVPGFLAISGFVVMGSIERRPLGQFFTSRAFRILPLLFVSFVFIGARHGWAEMTKAIGYWLWPVGPAPINPVLWTLIYEEAFYVLLALLFTLGVYRWRHAPLVLAVSCYFLVTMGIASEGIPRTAAYLGTAFFIGNAVYVYREEFGKLPLILVVPVALFTFGFGGTIIHDSVIRSNVLFDTWSYVVLVVLSVCVGQRAPKPIADLSFSLYLLHALIITEVWRITGYGWTMFWVVLTIALPLCVASWLLIEAPSQRLKQFLINKYRRLTPSGLAPASGSTQT